MSEDPPSPPPEEKSIATSAAVPEVVEQKLEEALKDVPESKRGLIRESIMHEFMAIVQKGATPTMDAETAKILADSADKEHEYRFRFRTQVQKDSADESLREHEMERIRHKDRVKFFWPILITVLLVVVGCLTVGIWLASHGQELLGTGLITGTSFAVAGYLAGVGTANFFKAE